MKPIITSLIDSDMYKFTTQQAVHNLYPDVKVRYQFIDREKRKYTRNFYEELCDQVDMMSLLSLDQEEAEYLHNPSPRGGFQTLEVKLEEENPIFSDDYIEWLSWYRFDPNTVEFDFYNGEIKAEFVGNWDHEILWETPFLAMFSELYFKTLDVKPDPKYTEKTRQKINLMRQAIKHFNVSDFGTRRRFSKEIHENVLKTLNMCNITATSNLKFAMELGMDPVGTFPHEWIMGHSALYGVGLANQTGMRDWYSQYHGKLDTVLTDTYTTEFFIQNLSLELADMFSKYRQDSGDPVDMSLKLRDGLINIGAYSLGRGSSRILCSDDLNAYKAIDIAERVSGIPIDYGIGTNFTNDVGTVPLKIVMKPIEFWIPYHNPLMVQREDGWIEVCKLSDDPGKYSGSKRAIENALEAIK